ncbi:hypothetical protein BC831DRAFT_463626 [Entophlyctis helioformis]|nr:hypothetical protein BC831DRAFT_463626 [Entophlyctis helioformis]
MPPKKRGKSPVKGHERRRTTATKADADAHSDAHADADKMRPYIGQDDLPYEEACVRQRYSLKAWLRYWHHKAASPTAPHAAKVLLLERAVRELPGSYKLWKLLLDLRVDRLLDPAATDPATGLRRPRADFPPAHPEWLATNACFERSLMLCNKFPVIWLAYARFLMHQPARISFTRRTFDRALQSLPTSQHKRVWDLYLRFAELVGGETCVRVWRRFLKLEPHQSERFFASPTSGKTSYQYWIELCDLICDHPEEMAQDPRALQSAEQMVPAGENVLVPSERLDVDRILRAGIARFTDQVGKLWNSLARWWIVNGEFDRAREVYEEGIHQVATVRDFSIIFDAYAKMEEDIISASMERLAAQAERAEDKQDADGEQPPLDETDIDLHLARLEKLMERRPFLVNDVLLRQNPHNVLEWQNRAKLLREKGVDEKVIDAYTKGVSTVSPHKAHGRLQNLWVDFAKYYEETDRPDSARDVFDRAVQVPFKRVDDLAEVWCQWAEFEVRQDNFAGALQVLGRGTTPPRGMHTMHANIRYNDESRTPQQRLFKSIKLWAFFIDLEESIGSPESTKAVYDRVLELKIATPQIIINYAAFLEENKYYEESFRVYERGIDLFGYPIAFEIWNLYLTKFIGRYAGTKLERARDLFEHALEKCPPKFAKTLYLLFAKLEEDYGLTRHAMRVYDRATRAVSDEDRAEMFEIYISKTTSFFGLVSTRDIYQRALETLPDRQARDFALKFADMETKLGEVDRARAILAYASQVSDPRMDPGFWRSWQEFEVKYGNEDTFKEMLRIKRSVQAKFNTEVSFISAQILAARRTADGRTAADVPETFVKSSGGDAMEELELAATGDVIKEQTGGTRVIGLCIGDDDDDDDDDDDQEDDEEAGGKEMHSIAGGIQKQSVPAGVFGGLASKAAELGEDAGGPSAFGARERLQGKRKRD